MIPLFFFLACSEPENSEKQPVPPTKNPLRAEPSEEGGISEPTKQPVSEETAPSPPEAEQRQEPNKEANIVQAPPEKKAVLPSPDIDGMVKKEKEDKIHAEDIDAYINKTEKAKQQAEEEKVVEVKVESVFNEHLNDTNSQIYVQVYKDPSSIAASMSHDHAIRARGFEGQVIWKSTEPQNCMLEFQVPVHFLDVDPDALRKSLNLPGVLSRKDRKEIRKNMLSKDQLWAEKYSYINFSANNCVLQDDGVRIDGKITIRGVTKKISTVLKIDSETKLHISGSFHLNQTSFGITPYSAFMGAVKNKNRIKISLDLNQ